MATPRRKPLSRSARAVIFTKTNGHCHVCAGPLDTRWAADHVVPHAAGGPHRLDNYLPVCSVCNRARWHYTPEQIRQILKIGVLLQLEVNKGTALGQRVADYLARRERESAKRRSSRHPAGPAVPPSEAS